MPSQRRMADRNWPKEARPVPRRALARSSLRMLWPAAQLRACNVSPSALLGQQRSMRWPAFVWPITGSMD